MSYPIEIRDTVSKFWRNIHVPCPDCLDDLRTCDCNEEDDEEDEE